MYIYTQSRKFCWVRLNYSIDGNIYIYTFHRWKFFWVGVSIPSMETFLNRRSFHRWKCVCIYIYIYISISNTDSSMEYFGKKFCTLHRWNFKYIYIWNREFVVSIDGIFLKFVISDVSTDGNWLFNLLHVYAVSIIARLQRPLIFLCTLLVL